MFNKDLRYSIGNEKGEPIKDFYIDKDDAIRNAKSETGKTFYEMIRRGYCALYKDTRTDTIRRELLIHDNDIKILFYALDNDVVISNVYDDVNELIQELYTCNYTPVYMSIHTSFKICIDIWNEDTDDTSFEPIEHLELKIYDELLKE